MIKGTTEPELTAASVQAEITKLEADSKARLKKLRALLRVLEEEERQADGDSNHD